MEVEELKGGKKQLVISEIPYTMIGSGISKFLNDVASLVETKKTTDIVDISNQSSKEGIRIVLELKRGADVENLKNMLYKKTRPGRYVRASICLRLRTAVRRLWGLRRSSNIMWISSLNWLRGNTRRF